MFETEIMPVVVAFARQQFRDDDVKVSDAVTQAWFAWHTAKNPDLPASVWARHGVRRVRSGRDLPHIGTTPPDDALAHATSGAGMDEVCDRRPGPERLAEYRELAERLEATMKPRERMMVALLTSGARAKDVASELGISPGRVTQIRQALIERLEDAE